VKAIINHNRVPNITLRATDDSFVNLAEGGLTVVYVYPRISPAQEGAIAGWDDIVGARGCTSQSCGFRDHFAELQEVGVKRLFGLSKQSTDEQKEAVQRLHLPFPLLSDNRLVFASALELPLFEVAGQTFMKRITLIINDGWVEHIFYPIHQPEQNASEVMTWLATQQASQAQEINHTPPRSE
jgi:peroxiredoxin